MSSKQLSQLIRKAPPATVQDDEPAAAEPAPAPVPPSAPPLKKAAEPEVPIQVKIPESIRKQLYHLSVEEGVSLRTLMLRAIQSLGIEVPQDELNSRRRKLP